MSLSEANKDLEQSKINKEIATQNARHFSVLSSLIDSSVESVVMEKETVINFYQPLSCESELRLKALGFEITKQKASLDKSLVEAFEDLRKKVSLRFNNSEVENLVVDDEFGNVSAKVDDMNFVACGYLEDYAPSPFG